MRSSNCATLVPLGSNICPIRLQLKVTQRFCDPRLLTIISRSLISKLLRLHRRQLRQLLVQSITKVSISASILTIWELKLSNHSWLKKKETWSKMKLWWTSITAFALCLSKLDSNNCNVEVRHNTSHLLRNLACQKSYPSKNHRSIGAWIATYTKHHLRSLRPYSLRKI